MSNEVRLPGALLRELRKLAESAAFAGGEVARKAFGRRLSIRIKEDHSEVTQIDEAAQRAVIRHIKTARPRDLFIGEEAGLEGVDAKRGKTFDEATQIVWVIDPIDGTRNFIRGVPMFTCSVAAMLGGTPIVGAIYEPIGGVMFSAALGKGVTRDGKRLRTLAPRDKKHAVDDAANARAMRSLMPVIAIPSAWRSDSGAFVRKLLETSVVRSLGSGTLHLVYVAMGGIDATYMNNCKLWDIAAGALMVTEVGGRVTDPRGKPLFPIDLARYHGDEMPTLASRGDERVHRLMP
ncbi:MAG: inositol monophosphatase family protein [Phycisphaerae bacterium]